MRSSLNFPGSAKFLMVSAWLDSTFLSVYRSKEVPKRALYYSASTIPFKDTVREQRLSSHAQCMMPRVYFTRCIPKMMRTLVLVLLEKPEAMPRIFLSLRPTKSSNASILPSSQIMLQLPSLPNPIHAKAWSTDFLLGGGETTTTSTFSAIIE